MYKLVITKETLEVTLLNNPPVDRNSVTLTVAYSDYFNLLKLIEKGEVEVSELFTLIVDTFVEEKDKNLGIDCILMKPIETKDSPTVLEDIMLVESLVEVIDLNKGGAK